VTTPDNLAEEIQRVLQGYVSGVSEQIETDKKEVAQQILKELKTKGLGPYKDRTNDYRKGWRLKRKGKKYIVHNATDYQLTHLLEHGHAKRGGGRVPAYPHIAPIEEKNVADFLDRVERALRQ